MWCIIIVIFSPHFDSTLFCYFPRVYSQIWDSNPPIEDSSFDLDFNSSQMLFKTPENYEDDDTVLKFDFYTHFV